MSRHINLGKAELTKDEQAYVDARSWMKRARAEYFGQGGAPTEDPETEEVEPEVLTVEEWVKQARKAEIVLELKRREIEHDPKSSKDELGALLASAVNALEEDEDEGETPS